MDGRNRTDTLPCTRRVILAVRSRKYGNEDARFCNLHGAANKLALCIGRIGRAVNLADNLRHRGREDLFERFCVRFLDIGEYDGIQIRDDARHVTRPTDLTRTRPREVFC